MVNAWLPEIPAGSTAALRDPRCRGLTWKTRIARKEHSKLFPGGFRDDPFSALDTLNLCLVLDDASKKMPRKLDIGLLGKMPPIGCNTMPQHFGAVCLGHGGKRTGGRSLCIDVDQPLLSRAR